MKILRLDLLRFGPFTGDSLLLDAGQHGLHIVYGPNEAGKSWRAAEGWDAVAVRNSAQQHRQFHPSKCRTADRGGARVIRTRAGGRHPAQGEHEDASSLG